MTKCTCPIHKIPLVCPTCLAIERGRRGGERRTPKQQAAFRSYKDKVKVRVNLDPSYYSSDDALETFKAHPDREFRIVDLIDKTAAIKRESARKNVSMRVQFLKRMGKVVVIERGLYRLQKQV